MTMPIALKTICTSLQKCALPFVAWVQPAVVLWTLWFLIRERELAEVQIRLAYQTGAGQVPTDARQAVMQAARAFLPAEPIFLTIAWVLLLLAVAGVYVPTLKKSAMPSSSSTHSPS
ncbi:hypothetical protein ACPRNU_22585 [Chromobacterium vaccinii]|uniref:hypothetical protein n=1 Tax=Chromobacterium vaccinii TaxID=1108595 RepID=UPI003C787048